MGARRTLHRQCARKPCVSRSHAFPLLVARTGESVAQGEAWQTSDQLKAKIMKFFAYVWVRVCACACAYVYGVWVCVVCCVVYVLYVRCVCAVCKLTDVFEGSIVRCISRLDELCRMVKNGARIVRPHRPASCSLALAIRAGKETRGTPRTRDTRREQLCLVRCRVGNQAGSLGDAQLFSKMEEASALIKYVLRATMSTLCRV
eukprot:SAG11_NODE_166_length_13763_cov_8.292722_7_plen_203_part_00